MHNVFIFFLGIFYTLIFCIVLKYINSKANNKTKITLKWLLAAFIVKVLAGIAYGYIYAYYFPVSDSWSYFKESLTDTYNLLHKPSAFFTLNTNLSSFTDFFSNAYNAFWGNAGENALIKLLSVINVFSDENYYVSSVLYNIISFTGLYFLYKVVAQKFPEKKLLMFLVIFFLPSNLFWSSGIDKEGLIVFFSGLLIFSVNKCIASSAFNYKNISIAFLSFCGILLMRNATALVFIPAIFAWYLSTKINIKKYVVYTFTFLLFGFLFFASGYFGSKYNMPLKLAEKQHEFLQLQANSTLPLTALQPTFKSYLAVLPQAVNHIFLRPYITEIKSPFYLLTFLENLLVFLIILAAVLSSIKQKHHLTIFSLFLLSFSISGYLLIGYTVPFTGAIIRYKAFYTILFLLPIINFISFRFKKSNYK